MSTPSSGRISSPILLCIPLMNLSNHRLYVGLSVSISFFSSFASTDVFIPSTEPCQYELMAPLLFLVESKVKLLFEYFPGLKDFFNNNTAAAMPAVSLKAMGPRSGKGGFILIFSASAIVDLISKNVDTQYLVSWPRMHPDLPP